MELIIFSGVQCSGKSTLYQRKFFGTHAQINLDTLKSRKKEMQLYLSHIEKMRPIVIDNTNATTHDRAKYIVPAKAYGYRVIGIQIDIPISIAITRNSTRQTQAAVPVSVICATHKRMQPLAIAEGFDEIVVVRFKHDGRPEVTRVVR